MSSHAFGSEGLSIRDPLRVDFDVEVDVVVDEVLSQEAEEFAGAVVAAVGGAVEGEDALGGEVLAFLRRSDEDGEFQRVANAAEGEGAAQEIVRRAVGAGVYFLRCFGDELRGGMVRDVEEIGGVQVRDEHGDERGVSEQVPDISCGSFAFAH